MKKILVFGFICWMLSHHARAQTPSSQVFVFAGIPAGGFDYSKKISRKNWSTSALSIAASPTFFFTNYNFDFSDGKSKFNHYRILVPVTLRVNLYLNQIIMPTVGKKKIRFGAFLDAGYAVSYTLKAHLHEEFTGFTFDGEIASGSEKLSFHPTIGFGMNFGRMLIYFRAFTKPYQWKDRSKEWELSQGQTSYFYSWEYTQTGVMVCLGFQL